MGGRLDAKPKAVQLIRATRNVLVSQTPSGLRILVSDFGLARRLGQDQSSFAPTANNLAGSLGWRAPECIRGVVRLNEGFDASSSVGSSGGIANAEDGVARSRLTKAVDLFALGCLYFWVLLSGEHPFGETYNRESNIVKGEAVNMGMLSLLGEEREEVEDLVGRLLSSEPDARYVPFLVALQPPNSLDFADHPHQNVSPIRSSGQPPNVSAFCATLPIDSKSCRPSRPSRRLYCSNKAHKVSSARIGIPDWIRRLQVVWASIESIKAGV